MSIQESYFIDCSELDGKEYLLNVQNQSVGKTAKFPFQYDDDKISIRISGANMHVQDELQFKGESEWVEIYSDIITNYLADHQQGQDG